MYISLYIYVQLIAQLQYTITIYNHTSITICHTVTEFSWCPEGDAEIAMVAVTSNPSALQLPGSRCNRSSRDPFVAAVASEVCFRKAEKYQEDRSGSSFQGLFIEVY